MIKLVTVEQMREIEAAADAAGVTYNDMMQSAGRAVADVISLFLNDRASQQRVAFLIGPGNNGGDGLVAARLLAEETDAEIGAYLLKPRSDEDMIFASARDAGIFVAHAEDDQRWRVLKNLINNADIVVDALFGTGARLPIEGDAQKILTHAGRVVASRRATDLGNLNWPAVPMPRGAKTPIVVAVDCPSGLDCDTGKTDRVSLSADVSVTFAAAKFGQVSGDGAEKTGELVIADIGVPEDIVELSTITTALMTVQNIRDKLPQRHPSGHKGTFGRAVIVAGSVNYTGAAALAAAGTYRAGAGLTTLAVPQAIYPILAAQLPEVTWLLLPHTMGVINASALDIFADEVGDLDSLVIGPGLGTDDETIAFMRGLFRGQGYAKRGSIGFMRASEVDEADSANNFQFPEGVVIDADGLNILAEIDQWWDVLPIGTILTPHPGEMARLTGMSVEEIQVDRIEIARHYAHEWNCIVVLKGAHTVVAAPDGHASVSPFATSALATAGTGDVLAGCIGGLLAQQASSFDAAVAGVYLHGMAGIMVGEQGANRSVVASDLLSEIPRAMAAIEG